MARSAADTGPADVLRQHGVKPSGETVLSLLHSWHPDAARRSEIAAAIGQLGDSSYAARELATQRLASWGAMAIAPLRAAARSDDPEAATRAASLVSDWELGPRRLDEDDLLAAAAQWLVASPAPQAFPFLLELLPDLPDQFSEEAVGAALWACTQPSDAPAVRKALDETNGGLRAVLIPALELAQGESALQVLQPALKDPDERIRLAAARALIDRRPHDSIDTLIGLLGSDDANVRGQAAWLLRQSSGIPGEDGTDSDFADLARKWTDWALGVQANPPRPMGLVRLQTGRFGELLLESFARDADQQSIITQAGYGKLQYQTTVEAGVLVKDGMLRLEGGQQEGDQRFFADSNRLLGLPRFPRHLVIKAAVGGEATNTGDWHVGIAAGNVRLLFHPGYAGGAFRAESVRDNTFLTANQSMPFTPEAGVLYDMTLKVARDDAGDVTFDVTISNPSNPEQQFTRSLAMKKANAGDVSRIALERSGRTGGAALFGPVSIREASAEPFGEKK